MCGRWDPSLVEWDPNDFRIFVGDMGSEVNDEILSKAFSHYSSFVKGKMVRNKQTNKNKGAAPSLCFIFHRGPLPALLLGLIMHTRAMPKLWSIYEVFSSQTYPARSLLSSEKHMATIICVWCLSGPVKDRRCTPYPGCGVPLEQAGPKHFQ